MRLSFGNLSCGQKTVTSCVLKCLGTVGVRSGNGQGTVRERVYSWNRIKENGCITSLGLKNTLYSQVRIKSNRVYSYFRTSQITITVPVNNRYSTAISPAPDLYLTTTQPLFDLLGCVFNLYFTFWAKKVVLFHLLGCFGCSISPFGLFVCVSGCPISPFGMFVCVSGGSISPF